MPVPRYSQSWSASFGGAVHGCLPRADLVLDGAAAARPARAGADVQVAGVDLRRRDQRHEGLVPRGRCRFSRRCAAAGRFFSRSASGFPPSRAFAICWASGARKLEEDVGPDGQDRGAHVGRVLVKVLIRGHRPRRRTSAPRRGPSRARSPYATRFWTSSAIDGEEVAAAAGEERVLDGGEEQGAERRRLLAQPSFIRG